MKEMFLEFQFFFCYCYMKIENYFVKNNCIAVGDVVQLVVDCLGIMERFWVVQVRVEWRVRFGMFALSFIKLIYGKISW